MIDVDLPTDNAVPEPVRSFAACLASATETPVAEVPQPAADLSGAIAHWRSWLAARGAGLVAIAKPASFNWPGYWLAVLGDGTVVLDVRHPRGRGAQPAGPGPARSGRDRPADP